MTALPHALKNTPRNSRRLQINVTSSFSCTVLPTAAWRSVTSQTNFTTDSIPPFISSWRQAPWDSRPLIFLIFFNRTFAVIVLMQHPLWPKGWICRLQLLLVLASVVIFRPESRGTHDDLLLSQISDSPRNRVPRLYPQALGSLFFASYDSQGCGGGIRPCPYTGET
jgi:hypothetical protein